MTNGIQTTLEMSGSVVFDIISALLGDASGLATFIGLGASQIPPTSSVAYNQVYFAISPSGGTSAPRGRGTLRQAIGYSHDSTLAGASQVNYLFTSSNTSTTLMLNQGSATTIGLQVKSVNFIVEDALCIAGLTLSQNGGSSFGFSGDTWASCGYTWTYGGVGFGQNSSGQTNYPACIALSQNGPSQYDAVRINFPAFEVAKGASPPANNQLCDTGHFTVYHGNNPTGPLPKRATQPSQAVNETRFILSTIPENKAAYLCSSASSYGPDFVNVAEGYYCNMKTRALLTVCPFAAANICRSNCYVWNKNTTMTLWTDGEPTKTTQDYAEMIRHPFPVGVNDTLPNACSGIS